jgi:hypothetical protein
MYAGSQGNAQMSGGNETSGSKQRDSDVRMEIPAWATLGHEIIRVAEERTDTERAKAEILSRPEYSQSGITPSSFRLDTQPAQIASLLYCLVVVPKEILDYPKDHFLFRRLDRLSLKDVFQISTYPPGFEEAPSYWLIRVLRNSVAHVLYEFDRFPYGTMHFWTNQPPLWEASISFQGLSKFFSTFGKELANTLISVRRNERAGQLQ